MNAEVQNVGAASEAAVVAPEVDLYEEALKISTETSFAEKAKEVACKVCESVKEFAHEVWEDQEGRKLLKDIGIALCVRLAFRHPLTAGIALGIVGHQVWQEIKAAKEAYTNN
jgi:hypothetical protein